MNAPPKLPDYTTRKNYLAQYRKDNRDAINARKREWKKRRKIRTVNSLWKH